MPLTVNIVSPEGVLFRGEAEHVSLMTIEGSIGLYPAHEPILSVLRPCSVRIVTAEKTVEVPIGGGFVSLDDNQVTVVADPPVTAAG